MEWTLIKNNACLWLNVDAKQETENLFRMAECHPVGLMKFSYV